MSMGVILEIFDRRHKNPAGGADDGREQQSDPARHVCHRNTNDSVMKSMTGCFGFTARQGRILRSGRRRYFSCSRKYDRGAGSLDGIRR
jgi:hypothetical protein